MKLNFSPLNLSHLIIRPAKEPRREGKSFPPLQYCLHILLYLINEMRSPLNTYSSTIVPYYTEQFGKKKKQPTKTKTRNLFDPGHHDPNPNSGSDYLERIILES